jgi:hypothetical protein
MDERWGDHVRRLVLEQPVSGWAIWSVRLALFAAVVALYGVNLVRGGQQGLPGLTALASGFVLAAVALLSATIAAVAIWNRGMRGSWRALFAGLLALALLAGPAWIAFRAATLPAINDVTTDIDNAPAFSRSRLALDARGGLTPPEPPVEHRLLQRAAYAGLTPVITDLPPLEAFDLALRAARARGWRIIEAQPPGGRAGVGRIEAIATTPVLRFQDDVTIRVRARVDGARIDIRSASRIGRHDLGANAGRIAAFLAEVDSLLAER